MKTNSTREMIDYSWTRGKKRIKRIEAFMNTIKAFIHIFDRTFEVCLLFDSELGYSYFV